MGFFDDDDFMGGGIGELFNRLAQDGLVEYSSIGPDGKKRIIKRGKRSVFGKLFLNKVITKNKTYLVFDLTNKNNISAKIKGKFSEEKILEVKENDEVLFEYPLEEINTSGFEYNFNNGILEVSFKK